MVVRTKGKSPTRNLNGGPSKKYISPYKVSKAAARSPQRKNFAPLENPQMTFGQESSPSRQGGYLAQSVKVRTPASQRPKGSFMNPTQTRMLKQISKSDLMNSQSNLSNTEPKTFSKRRATEQSYGYSLPYDNYQKALKALDQTKKDKESAARPQSAFVAKTQAKPAKKKLGAKIASSKNLYITGKGNLENPELAEEPPVDIRLNSASKYERPLT